jgi:hypothetical protein
MLCSRKMVAACCAHKRLPMALTSKIFRKSATGYVIAGDRPDMPADVTKPLMGLTARRRAVEKAVSTPCALVTSH